ncbi:MAG: hypothetical protein AB7F89_20100, partial [Pirellulaceae bacterium]
MRSIPLALLWELQARNRWTIVAACVGANLLPWLLFPILRPGTLVPLSDPSLKMIHLIFVELHAFAVGAGLIAVQGHPARLYAWPISNATLALWHMVPVMLLTMCETAIGLILLNGVFLLQWPVWGPAVFSGVAVGAAQAAYWWTDRTIWLPWVTGAMVVIGSLWLNGQYGGLFMMPRSYWRTVTPVDLAVLAATGVAAVCLGAAALRHRRRGDSLPDVDVLRWLESLGLQRGSEAVWRSWSEAQTWYAWRTGGWLLPVLVAAGGSIALAVWAGFNRDLAELREGTLAFGGFLCVAALPAGILMGHHEGRHGTAGIGPFLATRPLSAQDLASTLLRVMGLSVLMAWGLWAATLLLVVAACEALGMPRTTGGPGWILLALVASWTSATVVLSIMAYGRPKLLAQLLLSMVAVFVSSLFLSQLGLTDAMQSYLGEFVRGGIG